MKKAGLISFILVLSLSLLVAGCGSNKTSKQSSQTTKNESSGGTGSSSNSSTKPSGPTEKLNLKMSVPVGDTTTMALAAKKFADDVKQKTNGRINIKVYANNVLSGGNNGKALELLIQGQTDLTYDSTIIYSILDPRFGVVSAPFMFKNFEEVDKVLGGKGGQAISKILRDKGVEPLGFGQNGFRQVTNNVRPIKSPIDLNGLKFRIPGIKMYVDLWHLLGADPVKMEFSELFTSLQQGVVDGQENPIDLIYNTKFYEVQKYVTVWNYSYDAYVLGMNKKRFDSLDPADQKIIQDAAAMANQYEIKTARDKQASEIKKLKDLGMKFYYPTPDELTAFKDKVAPIYKQYEPIWGKDLLDAFQAR